jgi:2-hydroxychromene-2-carboxylate isomerase
MSGMDLLFYFDYSSPFAYLGATQVELVARRHGARLLYRPILLGGLFRQIGTPNVPFFAMPQPKQRHASDDMARWADHYRVPFSFPSRFPMNTVKPLRMTLAVAEEHRFRLVHPFFRAYWVEDEDLADDATLGRIASAAGFDGPRLVADVRDSRWKQGLRGATERAEAMGVCGAPCFVVRDPIRPQEPLLFWGQDRLVLVEKALGGWKGGALDVEDPETAHRVEEEARTDHPVRPALPSLHEVTQPNIHRVELPPISEQPVTERRSDPVSQPTRVDPRAQGEEVTNPDQRLSDFPTTPDAADEDLPPPRSSRRPRNS